MSVIPEILEYGRDKLTRESLRKMRDRVGYNVKVTFQGTGETFAYRVASASSHGVRLILDNSPGRQGVKVPRIDV